MQSIYTYKKNRKCLHCGLPIADQKHASLKFCPRQVLADGSVKSCKDDYHSPRRKIANEPFKRLVKHHKNMYLRIDDLIIKKGAKVSLDDLDQWKIGLRRPIEFSMEGSKVTAYYYIYAIKQISTTEYKIYKHGREF